MNLHNNLRNLKIKSKLQDKHQKSNNLNQKKILSNLKYKHPKVKSQLSIIKKLKNFMKKRQQLRRQKLTLKPRQLKILNH